MEPTSGAPDDELAILAADPERLSMFVGEALDHLGTIESVVLQLESAPADVKLLEDEHACHRDGNDEHVIQNIPGTAPVPLRSRDLGNSEPKRLG